MPNTRRKVRVTTDHPQALPNRPVVMVDGEILYGVTEININYSYEQGPLTVGLTLLGADVELEGVPDYLVKVVGPKPQEEKK